MNPIDLLPIKNPQEYEPEDPLFFYNNVINYLIPDIVQMENNGIPISLDKVDELDKIVSNILEEINNKLKNNPIMLSFLKSKLNKDKKQNIKSLEEKKKTIENFLKPFDSKNKIHRSYVVNEYLDSKNLADKKMKEWSVKDVKKLNQTIASNFLNNLLNNEISNDNSIITTAMYKLAEDKCTIYNKNKIDEKINIIAQEKSLPTFNTNSPTQLREFFEFYGIESENVTPTKNPKWDRKELERIQKLLKILIEEKENSKEK